jgi:hypothetical protein
MHIFFHVTKAIRCCNYFPLVIVLPPCFSLGFSCNVKISGKEIISTYKSCLFLLYDIDKTKLIYYLSLRFFFLVCHLKDIHLCLDYVWMILLNIESTSEPRCIFLVCRYQRSREEYIHIYHSPLCLFLTITSVWVVC